MLTFSAYQKLPLEKKRALPLPLYLRNNQNFLIPQDVKDILNQLDHAGFIAFLVGGCVRDFILGIPSKDYDVATDAPIERLCELFPEGLTLGKAFGVIKVPMSHKHGPLSWAEVASFRKDLSYKDYRRPVGVEPTDWVGDAQRRDFTINGMFFDVKRGVVLDVVGGLLDLSQKVLRCIGDPHQRFQEDALRLMRAVRFKNRFALDWNPETARGIQDCAKLLGKISQERIREELTGILQGKNLHRAFQDLVSFGLWDVICPEMSNPEMFQKVTKTLQHLEQWYPLHSFELSLALLVYELTAEQSMKTLQALKLSKRSIQKISFFLEENRTFEQVFSLSEANFQRWIRKPFFEELLAFHRIQAVSKGGNLLAYEFARSAWNLWKEQSQGKEGEHERFLTGKDLLELGLQAGPQFAEIFQKLDDLVLEKKINTKQEAYDWLFEAYLKNL